MRIDAGVYPQHLEAAEARDRVLRARVRMLAGRVGSGGLDEEMVTALLDTNVGAQARHMLTHTVAGDAAEVAQGLADFAALPRIGALALSTFGLTLPTWQHGVNRMLTEIL